MKSYAIILSLLVTICNAKVLQLSEPSSSSIVKFEDDSSLQNVSPPQERHLKPLKFDTSPVMASHPYEYVNPIIDTYPYAATVNPGYIPPVLKENSGNSKLDHPFGGGGDHHNKGLYYSDAPTHPWQKLLKVITAAIPIGLFLAALPPNVVYVNPAQPGTKPLGTPVRQRSDAEEEQTSGTPAAVHTFPVLDMIEKVGGLTALEKPECEAFVFCNMARMGATSEANAVQRFLWTTAQGTPDSLADIFGLREIMKAIRTDSCSIYKCSNNSVTLQQPTMQP